MRNVKTSGFSLLALTAGLIVAVSAADAHDFWLVPDAFQVARRGEIVIRGQTSSRFPTSESAVALDRIAEALLIGPGGQQPISEMSHRGKSLVLKRKPSAAGQHLVAVKLLPRNARETVAGFRRYLELEGAPAARERIDREGLLEGKDSVTRRYAKYAKTFVQVGSRGPRVFDRVVGHPLEFVPLGDPARVVRGDTLPLRVLYRGAPQPGLHVHAGAADWPSSPDSAIRASARLEDVALVSDDSGVIKVPVTRIGIWNVRAIQVHQAPAGSGADWDTHWATLVFIVNRKR